MSNSSKLFIGGLVIVNLSLIGLLLFRERSTVPARAEAVVETTQALAPEAVTLPVAPGEGAAPGTTRMPVAEAPEREPERVPAPEPTPAPRKVAPLAPAHDIDVEAAPQPVERPRPARREPAVRKEAPRQASRPAWSEPDRGAGAAEVPGDGEIRPEGKVATLRPEGVAGDLRRKPASPHPEPVEPPRPTILTMRAGTQIPIRLDVALHSRQVRNGDRFEASLEESLVVGGVTLARAGSPVVGRVIEVIESGRVKGHEQMKLALAEVTLAGKSYIVDTSAATFVAEDDTGRDAAIVGGASAIGALIGGIAKGGKGAATGAASGAAAGAGVVLSTRGKPVVLKAGTLLDFTLESPVRVSLPPGAAPEEPRLPPDEPEEEPESGGIARR